jgi:O-antigen polysaccharide polymerase Wzy
MDPSKLSELLIAWVAVLGVLVFVRIRWNIPGTGLTLAYLLSLSLIHLVGAAIYLLPAFQDHDPHLTEMGFEQALYGVVAFAVGGLVITPILAYKGILPRAKGTHQPDPRLPKAYVACGVIFYILSATFLGHLPTATAIVSTGQQLVVAGLGLCCWKAWRENSIRRLIAWLAISLVLPFTTLITAGMLGYGAVAVLTILIFVSSFVRSPVKVILAGALVVYIGLSAYVSYMRDRTEIRATVWGEQSFEDRFDKIAKTVTTFEWFDPGNFEHLQRIDARLNQNFLVGAAVYQLGQTQNFARGETLWDALLALIPRAIWPEKPITAGSGNLVSRYTGIDFASGTSVGVGQVMEFYLNFGTPGVIIGFIIMGVLVTAFDWQAAERLARNDLHGFVLWFLPGIALLQVNGQLVEITASAAASLVVALFVNRLLDSWHAGSEIRPTGRVVPPAKTLTAQ